VRFRAALCFTVALALPHTIRAEVECCDAKSSDPLLFAGDLLLPGYGAYRFGKRNPALWIAAGRLATAWIAYDSWIKKEEYRSQQRAAAIADLYLGPGYKYADRISGGFKSTAEFKLEKERQLSYFSSAMTVHLLITAVSLYYTRTLDETRKLKNIPEFEITPKRVSLRFILLDF